MRHTLQLHPDFIREAVKTIEVDVARPKPGTLLLRYIVTGTIGDLLLPPVTRPARVDELWRNSCFEAFVRGGSDDYHEFNFAPSTQWAAYRFDGYRSGMSDADVAPPTIETRSEADRYEMQVSLDLSQLAGASWQLALSAVVEETNGRETYWALAHPPGKPDFHHPDSFVCELP